MAQPCGGFAQYDSVKTELADSGFPKRTDLPHIGNNLRVLQYKDSTAIWEGEVIEPDDPIPGL